MDGLHGCITYTRAFGCSYDRGLFGIRRRCVAVIIIAFVAGGHHLGRRTGVFGNVDIGAISRTGLVGRRGSLERQFHGALAGESVEVEQSAVGCGLWDPVGRLLLRVLGRSVFGASGSVVGLVLAVILFRLFRRCLLVAGDATAAIFVGARDDGTVVAGEPASSAVDHAIPPATVQLRDHLNDIALAETQTGAVVGFVVVKRADVELARGRYCSSVRVHLGRRAAAIGRKRAGCARLLGRLEAT